MGRLKVFVFDHLAAGGRNTRPSPQALRRQGEMLQQALLADLGALPGVEIVREARWDAASGPVADAYPVPLPELRRFGRQFAAGVQAADAVWPLVHQSSSMLERLSRGVLRGKRILLGSAPGAVGVAASKLKLAQVLADGGVAAVDTYSPHAPLPQDGGPWVVKPDDGAGCLDTWLFKDRAAALAWIRASASDGYVM